ncbi:MAG: hypothetical protein AAGC77_04145 [Pseudomonadota bacterium]
MSDKRKQSPHYIPELDPENPARPKPIEHKLMWVMLVCGAVALVGAGVAWYLGEIQIAIALAILGAVMIILF